MPAALILKVHNAKTKCFIYIFSFQYHVIISRLARKASLSAEAWAKCLLGACYSLYFLSLPCRMMLNRGKEHATLRAAFELLERATKLKVPCDEVNKRLIIFFVAL